MRFEKRRWQSAKTHPDHTSANRLWEPLKLSAVDAPARGRPDRANDQCGNRRGSVHGESTVDSRAVSPTTSEHYQSTPVYSPVNQPRFRRLEKFCFATEIVPRSEPRKDLLRSSPDSHRGRWRVFEPEGENAPQRPRSRRNVAPTPSAAKTRHLPRSEPGEDLLRPSPDSHRGRWRVREPEGENAPQRPRSRRNEAPRPLRREDAAPPPVGTGGGPFGSTVGMISRALNQLCREVPRGRLRSWHFVDIAKLNRLLGNEPLSFGSRCRCPRSCSGPACGGRSPMVFDGGDSIPSARTSRTSSATTRCLWSRSMGSMPTAAASTRISAATIGWLSGTLLWSGSPHHGCSKAPMHLPSS